MNQIKSGFNKILFNYRFWKLYVSDVAFEELRENYTSHILDSEIDEDLLLTFYHLLSDGRPEDRKYHKCGYTAFCTLQALNVWQFYRRN